MELLRPREQKAPRGRILAPRECKNWKALREEINGGPERVSNYFRSQNKRVTKPGLESRCSSLSVVCGLS